MTASLMRSVRTWPARRSRRSRRSLADDDAGHLELPALGAPHVGESDSAEPGEDAPGAIRAHFHQQPSAGTEPARRLGGGALHEAEAVDAPIGERVDGLEPPDLLGQ